MSGNGPLPSLGQGPRSGQERWLSDLSMFPFFNLIGQGYLFHEFNVVFDRDKLTEAVEKGDDERVRTILKESNDLISSIDIVTFLNLASKHGHVSTFYILMSEYRAKLSDYNIDCVWADVLHSPHYSKILSSEQISTISNQDKGLVLRLIALYFDSADILEPFFNRFKEDISIEDKGRALVCALVCVAKDKSAELFTFLLANVPDIPDNFLTEALNVAPLSMQQVIKQQYACRTFLRSIFPDQIIQIALLYNEMQPREEEQDLSSGMQVLTFSPALSRGSSSSLSSSSFNIAASSAPATPAASLAPATPAAALAPVAAPAKRASLK